MIAALWLVLGYWLGLGTYVATSQCRGGATRRKVLDSLLLGLIVPPIYPWAFALLAFYRWRLKQATRARRVEWGLSQPID